MRKFFAFDHIAPWMAIAFCIWIYAFRGFLASHFVLVEDAISYYDHTKYFVDSLLKGVFPLWDTAWFAGAPNDFFLQRIGAYNPFYGVIVFFRLIGVPHTSAYLYFLAFYYFLGMVGFYLFAMRIYQNQIIAFTGFLLLLFSALGTRLFDSYMMLVTVPTIWFFYTFVAFSIKPSRGLFLGMMLSLGILLTTYIPFYFLMFLGIFVLCFACVYGDQLGVVISRYVDFFKRQKRLVIACGLLVVLSLLPLLIFYQQTSEGTIALPGRHGQATDAHVLTVPLDTLKWGTLEDILYSAYFSDLSQYKFAIIYLPFFALVLLLLGAWGKLTRRFMLIFASGFMLLLFIIPKGLPFHDFLYKHLFFMKYFRNLHFFIWFVLIPLIILLVLESFKVFLDRKPSEARQRWQLLIYTQLMHLIALGFVWWRQDAIISTYIMIVLSGLFFGLMVLGRLTNRKAILTGLTLIIVLQPLEVYHYLTKRGTLLSGPYQYDRVGGSFKFAEQPLMVNRKKYPTAKSGLYYASKAYNDLYLKSDNYDFDLYMRHKLILMDNVPVMEGKNPSVGSNSILIEGNSPMLQVASYNANQLRIRTALPSQKFLVYNDSYDPRWRVFVNGGEAQLVKANDAFKGVWVPAGQAVVEFRFGSWWMHLLYVGLLIAFACVLIGAIVYGWLDARKLKTATVNQ